MNMDNIPDVLRDFSVHVRRGRVYLNGVERDHVVDRRDRTYTVATPLRDNPQLRRVIGLALVAGRHCYAPPDDVNDFDFDVGVLNGSLNVNGRLAEDHLDCLDRSYRIVTPLPISAELSRLIGCAFRAGGEAQRFMIESPRTEVAP